MNLNAKKFSALCFLLSVQLCISVEIFKKMFQCDSLRWHEKKLSGDSMYCSWLHYFNAVITQIPVGWVLTKS